MKILLAILALVPLTGCIQFKFSDGMQRTVGRINVEEQIQAMEITDVRPVLAKKNGCHVLSLEADGRFVRHMEKSTTYNVRGRRHVLAIGLFPGTWSISGMDLTMIWVVPLSATVANVFTLGYPTWNALFIEPFRDYHDATVGTGIESWGFIGCRKYLDLNVSETETGCETQKDSCKTIVMKGYSVVVGGVSYTPDDNGFVKLPNLSHGSNVKIELIAPPRFSKESNESGNELLGLVLECRCP